MRTDCTLTWQMYANHHSTPVKINKPLKWMKDNYSAPLRNKVCPRLTATMFRE
jgi:hypothetical protein